MIGIYKIQNKINNKIYIGQSIDIYKRIREHFLESRYNNPNRAQYNYHLDRAIRQYGKENFVTEIIEECEIKDLDEREQYWIKYYNSYEEGYNETLGGKGYIPNLKPVYQYDVEGNFLKAFNNIYEAEKLTQISKDRIRKVLSNSFTNKLAGEYQWSYVKTDKIPSTYQYIPILVFDFDGNKIGFFKSAAEASRNLKDSVVTILHCCKDNNLTGEYAQYRYWQGNENLEKIASYQRSKVGKMINQYDLNGNYLKTYNSIKEAACAVGAKSTSGISACCNKNGSQKNAYGYKWSFYGDTPNIEEKKLPRAKIIYQYDLNNNFIKKFNSARQAAKEVNGYHSNIIKCCNKKIKTAYEYIWRYEEDINEP